MRAQSIYVHVNQFTQILNLSRFEYRLKTNNTLQVIKHAPMTKETNKNVCVKKFIPSPSSSRAGKNEADNYFILMDFPILK